MVICVVNYRMHLRRTSPSRSALISILGLTPALIAEKIASFFSCTYVEPILQPFCFHIDACNGVYPPSPSFPTAQRLPFTVARRPVRAALSPFAAFNFQLSIEDPDPVGL